MTPDTAMRLARVFDTTPQYRMNMQTNYDMARAAPTIDVSMIEPLVKSPEAPALEADILRWPVMRPKRDEKILR